MMTTLTEAKKKLPKELMVTYSEELGIDLDSRKDSEFFKWWLASYLFGNRISEDIAKHTYREFEKAGVLSPEKMTHSSWRDLVDILDAGGYVRYDYSTASRLPAAAQVLIDMYGGSLQRLHDEAEDEADLEKRMQQFYGVGKTTANIFLREMRKVWSKADPEPTDRVKKTADELGIDLSMNRKTKTFMRLEAGLIRYRRQK